MSHSMEHLPFFLLLVILVLRGSSAPACLVLEEFAFVLKQSFIEVDK